MTPPPLAPLPARLATAGPTVAELAAALAAFPPAARVRFGPAGMLTFDRVAAAADGAAHVLFREVGGVEYGPYPPHRAAG